MKSHDHIFEIDRLKSEIEILKKELNKIALERDNCEKTKKSLDEYSDLISQIAIKLLGSLSSSELFKFVADQLYSVAEGALVSFSEFINQKIIVRELRCRDDEKRKLMEIIGLEPKGMEFDFPDSIRSRLIPGEMERLIGGFYELVFGQLPLDLCEEIENKLDIGDIFAMACSVESDILGTVAIINHKHKEQFKSNHLIQTIVNMAALALKRKRFEEALVVSESRLSELNSTKDKLFSIISHDLKSPFTSVIGLSDLLIDKIEKNDLESIKYFATMINESSWRAMDLLTNLIEWSRLQTGRIRFNPTQIDLPSLVDKQVKLLFDSAKQKTISVSTRMPEFLNVLADEFMLSAILRNIISNAVKFTNKDGEIVITIYEEDKSVLVEVADTGVGMKKESIEKLFNLEEMISKPGTENEVGTGLGMIICKEFISKHGGEIWVESEKDKGSRFMFTLPKQ